MMNQRDVSREGLELLTAILVELAEKADFERRWLNQESMPRDRVLTTYLLPDARKEDTIALLAEPNFELRFRYDPDPNGPPVVELNVYGRGVCHAWRKSILHMLAAI